MRNSTIDLHMHSACSDGSDPVPDLLQAVQRAGIRTFALTDHDTVDGLEPMSRLIPQGMRLIRGIEFSCLSPAGKCHILGYGFDPREPVFRETVREASSLRYDKLAQRLDYLKEHFGIVFEKGELSWLHDQTSPGRPHIAELLVKRGLASDIQDAFTRYLDQIPSPRIDAGKAIRAILSAGGIPVWAHPFGESPASLDTEEAVLDQLSVLMDLGLRGLECCYSQYDDGQEAFLLTTAAANGLLVSGGSDYHGDRKPIALGELGTGPEEYDPMERFTILRELLSSETP